MIKIRPENFHHVRNCHFLYVVNGEISFCEGVLSSKVNCFVFIKQAYAVNGVNRNPFHKLHAYVYVCYLRLSLKHGVRRYCLHAQAADGEAHAFIYRRLLFGIIHGVAEQFVGRMSDSFEW